MKTLMLCNGDDDDELMMMMFDCTLTEVEVWADNASNFRTRWQFNNHMKERKVDAAARQPLVLSKKYFLPNVMQLKENGSFGECLGDS